MLQEREWQFEINRRGNYGQYYFEDTPVATQEAMPPLALRLMGNPDEDIPKPTWTNKDLL